MSTGKNVKVNNFKVLIEQDEDGVFVASVPDIPGCYSQGKTYEEAVQNVREAVELCLDVARDYPDYKSKINYPNPDSQSRFLGVTEVFVQI
ncbi:MAG: hypothetical protein UU32_C0044G0004 [Candidatus Woesebacteria bacterium GW2011_GWB1_41_10]|uniref:HicB-like antitoxin of toxin-antitoxin system domain-containing protein n=1 Tax=Candidatus Woesebacteria bacterium GW2011_GWB1_41_10 TaxID=1618577 RepID=A0A0G0XAD3_9BACT|nr:MAG: hypothetical protein UR98_C0018G0015 [Parcubacteria group bacterium GW2011_GWA1_36_12]KKR84657.1 MAG: hypothetical protein UU32_C0044G0004 [Candidatus Woesebacteria bacterium GW2011_GWB1_41_10]